MPNGSAPKKPLSFFQENSLRFAQSLLAAAVLGGLALWGVAHVPMAPDDLWIAHEAGIFQRHAFHSLMLDVASTLQMVGLALALSMAWTLIFLAALFVSQSSWIKAVLHALCSIGVAVPSIWWAIGLWSDSATFLRPALVLALPYSAFWCLWWTHELRNTVFRPQLTGPAQWARALGQTPVRVFWNVGFLPNRRRFFGQWLSSASHLMAGSVVVETTFQRPGLGLRLVEAFHQRQADVLLPTLSWVLALSLFLSVLGRGLSNTRHISEDTPWL